MLYLNILIMSSEQINLFVLWLMATQPWPCIALIDLFLSFHVCGSEDHPMVMVRLALSALVCLCLVDCRVCDSTIPCHRFDLSRHLQLYDSFLLTASKMDTRIMWCCWKLCYWGWALCLCSNGCSMCNHFWLLASLELCEYLESTFHLSNLYLSCQLVYSTHAHLLYNGCSFHFKIEVLTLILICILLWVLTKLFHCCFTYKIFN